MNILGAIGERLRNNWHEWRLQRIGKRIYRKYCLDEKSAELAYRLSQQIDDHTRKIKESMFVKEEHLGHIQSNISTDRKQKD